MGHVIPTLVPITSSADAAQLLLLASMRVGGGAGSGNFGHRGRPGEQGGSASDDWSPDPNDDIPNAINFYSQVEQYPSKGKPGVSYFKGVIDDERHVDALLFRDNKGKIRGILNHFPIDFPGFEKKGNVTVMVDPDFQRQGIARKLFAEADKRWNINLKQQSYTESGRKFIQSIVKNPRALGGPGSGNFGHAGRPGEVGGSAEGWAANDSPRELTGKTIRSMQQYVAWKKSLTPNERYEIQRYVSGGYTHVNEMLRSDKPDEMLFARDYQQRAADITSALAKAPAPPDDLIVYRGIVPDVVKDVKLGDTVALPGFQSGSIDPWLAQRFNHEATTLLEIKPTQGAYIEPLSKHKGEFEFLMPHNAQYNVVGNREVTINRSWRSRVDSYEQGQVKEKRVKVLQLEMLRPTVKTLAAADLTTLVNNADDRFIQPTIVIIKKRMLGGPGSGNFGHAGRPGEHGGSASTGDFHVVPQSAIPKFDPKGHYPLYHFAPPHNIESIYFGQGIGAVDNKAYDPSAKVQKLDPNRSTSWTRDPHYAVRREESGVRFKIQDKQVTGVETKPSVAILATDMQGDNFVSGDFEHEEVVPGIVPLQNVSEIAVTRKVYEEWKTLPERFRGFADGHLKKADMLADKPIRQEAQRLSAKHYQQLATQYEQILSDPRLKVGLTIRTDIDSKKNRFRQFTDLGGPGSGNFGHAGRPGEHGGSAPSERTLSDADATRLLEENAARQTVHYGGQYVDMGKLSVADRVAVVDKFFEKDLLYVRKDKYGYGGKPSSERLYDAFNKEAKEKNWTSEEILREGLARELFSREKTDLFSYNAGSSYAWSEEGLLSNLDERGRDDLERELIPVIDKPGNSWSPSLEGLRDAGWTKPELERMADRLQDAKATHTRWERTSSLEGSRDRDYRGSDSLAGNLAFFSKDYENFRSSIYGGWALMGGTQDAKTLRRVAEEAFPHPEGGSYFQFKNDPLSLGRDHSDFYSTRAIDNVKKLKAETEEFYGPKNLEKEITVVRGVGGHPTAYTPGSIESWSTDSRTAKRFAKLMSTSKEESSILTSKVKLKDVLWSYKSAAGKPGWPAEKDLKGKSEHVVLGRAVKDVKVDYQ